MRTFRRLLLARDSTLRSAPLLALTAAICLQRISFSTEPSPGGIEWEMLPIEDADGNWWNTFRIVSVPGVRYDIQKSGNLENPWETVASYYGSGADVYHPLFPGHQPTEPPSGTTPVVLPTAGSSELHFAFIVMELTENGQVVLSWQSLDSGLPVRYLLEGTTLDPVWDEFECGYFNIHGNYIMSISPRLHSVAPAPTPPVLAAEDQALAAAFVATLPLITQNIANSVATAAVATPPLPPDPSAKGFFRIRADWTIDSDGDGRFDWQELLLDGNSPYNADSDGDNIPDGEDLPAFQIGAAPVEPERPPVAELEHR